MADLLLSRRAALAGALSLGGAALAGCNRGEEAEPRVPASAMTLQEAVAGEWRPPEDKARDAWRHPAETLDFFGLKPGMTVVEMWPGAGWYTDILAPYLAASNGKLYAANLQPSDPASVEVVEAYRQKLRSRPRLYGEVEITAFGPTSGPIAPAGTADLVLTFRNIHNWMAGGIVDKAFADAFAALKPGGVFGVVEHRAEPGGVQDPAAASGYVDQAYVIRLGQEAGFILDRTSEINANPRDTKDHPFGVWTLPPVGRTSPRGEPVDPDFDRSRYEAIGESDRMTLRFVKPT
ncbi:methyltransferase [Phenylobacterium sp.]|uniref:class I SAM-dependent methyltransferase n=1 Tax=Phenylobacterium sp. TaxID=1871053 RepID=UPI0008CF749B|nr:methyltransferase [Phenylobacterium sp.]MBA4793025.1 class I SAM-dependent methyltransferase [Phenylobacterium sp.]MBC7165876.1 class I SAM-dependent methyltransferase [Phenylobacterium sp.]OHB40016.1 MAG: methyltransferase [Phenylobacterium sp. RIFCSPHIGHO2_01_FULL_70_10]